MPNVRRDDIERLRERLQQRDDELATFLLEDLPQDYDPVAAPLQLSAGDGAVVEVEVQASGLEEALQLAAQKIGRDRKLELLEQARRHFLDDAVVLNEQVKAGNISPLTWNVEMRDLLKDLHVSAYVIGKSGKWTDMTQSDWGRVGRTLREQYQFLRGFAQELYDLEDTSIAKLNARLALYAAAASQSLHHGMASEIGVETGALPAYPGDGTTLCRANCRCRWAIRILSKARGDYDASWRMASAEHCRTCRARARAWKKLRIRAGVLIDGYEPLFAPS